MQFGEKPLWGKVQHLMLLTVLLLSLLDNYKSEEHGKVAKVAKVVWNTVAAKSVEVLEMTGNVGEQNKWIINLTHPK